MLLGGLANRIVLLRGHGDAPRASFLAMRRAEFGVVRQPLLEVLRGRRMARDPLASRGARASHCSSICADDGGRASNWLNKGSTWAQSPMSASWGTNFRG